MNILSSVSVRTADESALTRYAYSRDTAMPTLLLLKGYLRLWKVIWKVMPYGA
jgi:hypothetical protein